MLLIMTQRKVNEAGFTLVELMVVCGIIGILVSIAIPSYQGYRARARQTEAKLQLGSIYTAETSFAIEYQSFTTCLAATGFELGSPNMSNFYAIGFASASADCGMDGLTDCQFVGSIPCSAGAFPAGGFWPATASMSGPPVSNAVFEAGVTTTISSSKFTAAAMGVVSASGAAIPDTWTIDEGRNLVNLHAGL